MNWSFDLHAAPTGKALLGWWRDSTPDVEYGICVRIVTGEWYQLRDDGEPFNAGTPDAWVLIEGPSQ